MMKQEDLFKKLGLILNELNDHYQYLSQNPQQLNELELSLLLANANFLVDHIQIIEKINRQPQAPLALPVTEEVLVELPQAQDPVAEDIHEEDQVKEVTFANTVEESVFEPEEPSAAEIGQHIFELDKNDATFEFILNDHSEHEKFDYEDKSVDELFDRPLSEEEEQILSQKRKIREKATEEVVATEDDEIGPEPFLVSKAEEEFPIATQDLKLEEAPVASTEVNEKEPVEDPTYKPTLNDLLAKSAPTSINETSNIGISDLKQGINLNDKLLYIKDLFNGYNLAYAEAIDLANKLPNFEAADNFFKKNYATKNNWAEKQGTVDKFYELLNRRFKV